MLVDEKDLRKTYTDLLGEIRVVAKELGGEIKYLDGRMQAIQDELSIYFGELRKLNAKVEELLKNENNRNI